MGGIVDALASAGKDVVENFANKFDKSEISNLWSRIRPMENEFNKSEAGKDLLNTTRNYIQNYQKALQAGIDHANTLPKDLQPHPLVVSHQARNVARASTFGKNDSVGAYLLHQARKSPGMDDAAAEMHTQNMADFVSSILHDYETRPTWRKMTQEEKINFDLENLKRMRSEQDLLKKRGVIAGESAPFSTFKTNVSQHKEFPVNLKLGATYHPVSKLEHNFMQYANSVVYPLVVLPHLGTVMNDAISTPLQDLAKAAADNISRGEGTDYAKVMDFAHKAGVFASTAYDLYSANYYGSRGLLAKWGGDKVGQIFYKSTHNPLFDPARNWQLAITSSAGYHTALDMIDRLMRNPTDKRAIYELNKMGIEASDVLRQKGQLTDDQIQKALWRFVDSKIFLNNDLQRAYLSRSHPVFRIALMYHSYVTRQAKLILSELGKAGVLHDPAAMAQTVAVLGVAFPLVGLMTKNITTLARGDWSDIHPGQDIQDLRGKNGAKALLAQYAEDYAHTASFGIATSYLRGASRNAAANSMAGPLGNIAARGLYDTIHPMAQAYEGKRIDLKPLGRDFLEYGPWAIDNSGKLLTHALLPTKREEALRNPKPSFRFKSKVKRPHFKTN